MTGTEEYWTLAERDYKIIEHLRTLFPDIAAKAAAAYQIQQAVEKMLKAAALLSGGLTEDGDSVSKLTVILDARGFPVSDELKAVADTLTLWESLSRYDVFDHYTENKFSLAIVAYEKLRSSVDQRLHAIEKKK